MAKYKHQIIILFSTLILTILHYITSPDLPLLHDLYRRLYYIPIIYASFFFGFRGGVIVAACVSLLYFPHIIHRWGNISLQTYDAIFEIFLYFLMASITGILVEIERKKHQELTQAREKLAHLISLSLKKKTPTKAKINNNNIKSHFGFMIGENQAMQRIYTIIKKAGNKKVNVLIQGESGTGKELVAQAIHNESPRKELPFIAINCAAIPEQLLESELFGYKKGAFTGADTDKIGKFKLADKGTLFLDEIGAMPLTLQSKLLRILQSEEISPVGSEQSEKIDIRIIAATNENLLEQVNKKAFRADLFYRLNVVNIDLLPLRKRKDDIPILVQHFLQKHSESELFLSKETLKLLEQHNWPGNIRELENVIQRAITLNQGSLILPEDVSISGSTVSSENNVLHIAIPDEGIDITEIEKELLEKALKKTLGNQTKAAQLLGLTRSAFIYRCQKFQIPL
jgi:two-component system, NtrC family, response regulator AtoC